MILKEYTRGREAAKKGILKGEKPEVLLNQARGSLTNDAFDKGFKDFCKEKLSKQQL